MKELLFEKSHPLPRIFLRSPSANWMNTKILLGIVTLVNVFNGVSVIGNGDHCNDIKDDRVNCLIGTG